VNISVTYDHRLRKTGHPVRSAIHKPQIGRLVVGWVTTSEYLLLYVFDFCRSCKNFPCGDAAGKFRFWLADPVICHLKCNLDVQHLFEYCRNIYFHLNLLHKCCATFCNILSAFRIGTCEELPHSPFYPTFANIL
ncbi:uncharacterized protein LY89DRAFT_765195, partial [Mollisia scopiformis]